MPNQLKGIEANPLTAWALAESYRNIGKPQEALSHYEQTAKKSDLGLAKIKSSLWSSIIAGEQIYELTDVALTPKKLTSLKRKAAYHDDQVLRIWTKLTPNQQRRLAVGYKEVLENNVLSPVILKAPPTILLKQWTNSLSTKFDPSTASKGMDAWKENYSPSASLVMFLGQLANRFTELGDDKKRRKTIALLQKMTPKDMGDDNEAKPVGK